MTPVTSGREELLYEDPFCYIVENHHLEIDTDNGTRYARARKCVVLKDHGRQPSPDQEEAAQRRLKTFLGEQGLEEGRDYFIRTTMRTFPEHYHSHAIIYPLTDEPQG
ncbi:MAG: hypothetical protein HYW25_05780 [Candidatus Aenigmarchaeota archaeon]|nr:hypothetical protein [Candidatus Aenigmarchaeota archaeon]